MGCMSSSLALGVDTCNVTVPSPQQFVCARICLISSSGTPVVRKIPDLPALSCFAAQQPSGGCVKVIMDIKLFRISPSTNQRNGRSLLNGLVPFADLWVEEQGSSANCCCFGLPGESSSFNFFIIREMWFSQRCVAESIILPGGCFLFPQIDV